MTKQIQNEEWMDQVDLEKIEKDDNSALIITGSPSALFVGSGFRGHLVGIY